MDPSGGKGVAAKIFSPESKNKVMSTIQMNGQCLETISDMSDHEEEIDVPFARHPPQRNSPRKPHKPDPDNNNEVPRHTHDDSEEEEDSNSDEDEDVESPRDRFPGMFNGGGTVRNGRGVRGGGRVRGGGGSGSGGRLRGPFISRPTRPFQWWTSW
jgi:uncharacterized membrane protein YgcG